VPQEQQPPKQSLIRRLLGLNPLPESLSQKWPELQRQWVGQEMEYPNEAARVNRIMEAGPIFKMLNPDAYAVTGPFGTISLNRELIEKDKQDLGNVLAHELGHVEQGKKGFLRQFYDRDKLEEGAINKESFRPRRTKDILLRAPIEEPKFSREEMLERMKKRPLYSESEVSPELVRNRDYYRKRGK